MIEKIEGQRVHYKLDSLEEARDLIFRLLNIKPFFLEHAGRIYSLNIRGAKVTVIVEGDIAPYIDGRECPRAKQYNPPINN